MRIPTVAITPIIACKRLSMPQFNKEFLTNVTKPVLAGRTGVFTSYLGTLFVPFRYLNTMIIQPKYNSPSSDVSTSNGSPLHSDGSHPIGGYLLGN